MSPKKRYVVDLTGYGHVSTKIVEATSVREAKQKAMEEAGISVKVRP